MRMLANGDVTVIRRARRRGTNDDMGAIALLVIDVVVVQLVLVHCGTGQTHEIVVAFVVCHGRRIEDCGI